MTRRLSLKINKMVTRSSTKKPIASSKKIKKEERKAPKIIIRKTVLKGNKKKLI
jgi:hypothetical protein